MPHYAWKLSVSLSEVEPVHSIPVDEKHDSGESRGRVAQRKQCRYVHHHCACAKRNYPARYTCKEAVKEWFAELLDGLRFDDEGFTSVS